MTDPIQSKTSDIPPLEFDQLKARDKSAERGTNGNTAKNYSYFTLEAIGLSPKFTTVKTQEPASLLVSYVDCLKKSGLISSSAPYKKSLEKELKEIEKIKLSDKQYPEWAVFEGNVDTFSEIATFQHKEENLGWDVAVDLFNQAGSLTDLKEDRFLLLVSYFFNFYHQRSHPEVISKIYNDHLKDEKLIEALKKIPLDKKITIQGTFVSNRYELLLNIAKSELELATFISPRFILDIITRKEFIPTEEDIKKIIMNISGTAENNDRNDLLEFLFNYKNSEGVKMVDSILLDDKKVFKTGGVPKISIALAKFGYSPALLQISDQFFQWDEKIAEQIIQNNYKLRQNGLNDYFSLFNSIMGILNKESENFSHPNYLDVLEEVHSRFKLTCAEKLRNPDVSFTNVFGELGEKALDVLVKSEKFYKEVTPPKLYIEVNPNVYLNLLYTQYEDVKNTWRIFDLLEKLILKNMGRKEDYLSSTPLEEDNRGLFGSTSQWLSIYTTLINGTNPLFNDAMNRLMDLYSTIKEYTLSPLPYPEINQNLLHQNDIQRVIQTYDDFFMNKFEGEEFAQKTFLLQKKLNSMNRDVFCYPFSPTILDENPWLESPKIYASVKTISELILIPNDFPFTNFYKGPIFRYLANQEKALYNQNDIFPPSNVITQWITLGNDAQAFELLKKLSENSSSNESEVATHYQRYRMNWVNVAESFCNFNVKAVQLLLNWYKKNNFEEDKVALQNLDISSLKDGVNYQAFEQFNRENPTYKYKEQLHLKIQEFKDGKISSESFITSLTSILIFSASGQNKFSKNVGFFPTEFSLEDENLSKLFSKENENSLLNISTLTRKLEELHRLNDTSPEAEAALAQQAQSMNEGQFAVPETVPEIRDRLKKEVLRDIEQMSSRVSKDMFSPVKGENIQEKYKTIRKLAVIGNEAAFEFLLTQFESGDVSLLKEFEDIIYNPELKEWTPRIINLLEKAAYSGVTHELQTSAYEALKKFSLEEVKGSWKAIGNLGVRLIKEEDLLDPLSQSPEIVNYLLTEKSEDVSQGHTQAIHAVDAALTSKVPPAKNYEKIIEDQALIDLLNYFVNHPVTDENGEVTSFLSPTDLPLSPEMDDLKKALDKYQSKKKEIVENQIKKERDEALQNKNKNKKSEEGISESNISPASSKESPEETLHPVIKSYIHQAYVTQNEIARLREEIKNLGNGKKAQERIDLVDEIKNYDTDGAFLKAQVKMTFNELCLDFKCPSDILCAGVSLVACNYLKELNMESNP